MNVHRIRLDLGADPKAIHNLPVNSDVAVEIGDLMWYDTDDVKSASHVNLWEGAKIAGIGTTAQGAEAVARRKLARKFAGVAVSAKAAADTTITSIRVAVRGIAEYPLGTSVAYEPGALVGGDKASGNTLLAQSVEIVTDPQEAIGRTFDRQASASGLVKFEFASRFVAGGLYEESYTELEANYGGAYANDTLPLGMVRQPGRVVEALFTCHTLPSAAARINIDIQKADGTSLLSAAAILDPGILTAAGAHVSLPLHATAANVNVDEGDSLKVVFTNSNGTQGQDFSVKVRIKKNMER